MGRGSFGLDRSNLTPPPLRVRATREENVGGNRLRMRKVNVGRHNDLRLPEGKAATVRQHVSYGHACTGEATVPCKHGVKGATPFVSTNIRWG